jgi:CBS domain-containing protein
MPQTIRDVMTPDPVVVSADTPIAEAARLMRDQDIGPVIVAEKDRVHSIVTDRDLVV